MRILIINAVYKIRSTGRTYYELSNYARENGYECLVVYGNQLGNYDNTIFMGNKIDHKLHALKSRITGKAGCFSRFHTRKLLKFIKQYNPDIVHLGNLHGNFINVPMLLNFLGENNIATALTLHDCFFFTGYCTHYTLNKCYKWKQGCEQCAFVEKNTSWFFDKSKFLWEIKKQTFNGIQNLGVIGVSDWITNESKQSPVFKKAKVIKRIYNWVDLDVFKPIQSDVREELKIKDKIVLGAMASKWDDTKGLDKIIKLSRRIEEKYVILLIGKVDKNVELSNNIIHIDFVENVTELAKLYTQMDLFLQFSMQETFGKVVAESLACGTPVLALNSTASPELVEDGCGQVLGENDSIEDIYNTIEQITEKGKEFYCLNCRKRAEEMFSKDKNLQEYLETYRYLIENKSVN